MRPPPRKLTLPCTHVHKQTHVCTHSPQARQIEQKREGERGENRRGDNIAILYIAEICRRFLLWFLVLLAMFKVNYFSHAFTEHTPKKT